MESLSHHQRPDDVGVYEALLWQHIRKGKERAPEKPDPIHDFPMIAPRPAVPRQSALPQRDAVPMPEEETAAVEAAAPEALEAAPDVSTTSHLAEQQLEQLLRCEPFACSDHIAQLAGEIAKKRDIPQTDIQALEDLHHEAAARLLLAATTRAKQTDSSDESSRFLALALAVRGTGKIGGPKQPHWGEKICSLQRLAIWRLSDLLRQNEQPVHRFLRGDAPRAAGSSSGSPDALFSISLELACDPILMPSSSRSLFKDITKRLQRRVNKLAHERARMIKDTPDNLGPSPSRTMEQARARYRELAQRQVVEAAQLGKAGLDLIHRGHLTFGKHGDTVSSMLELVARHVMGKAHGDQIIELVKLLLQREPEAFTPSAITALLYTLFRSLRRPAENRSRFIDVDPLIPWQAARRVARTIFLELLPPEKRSLEMHLVMITRFGEHLPSTPASRRARAESAAAASGLSILDAMPRASAPLSPTTTDAAVWESMERLYPDELWSPMTLLARFASHAFHGHAKSTMADLAFIHRNGLADEMPQEVLVYASKALDSAASAIAKERKQLRREAKRSFQAEEQGRADGRQGEAGAGKRAEGAQEA